jgi:hypothetical protein
MILNPAPKNRSRRRFCIQAFGGTQGFSVKAPKNTEKIRVSSKILLYVQIILATISARFGGGIAVD